MRVRISIVLFAMTVLAIVNQYMQIGAFIIDFIDSFSQSSQRPIMLMCNEETEE